MLGTFAESDLFTQQYLIPGSPVSVYTSPMRRTLLTAKPLGEGLGVIPECLPSVFEKGGDKEMQYGSACLTAEQIRNEFGYLTGLLPDTGGWFVGGEENDGAFEHRIREASSFLSQKAFAAAEAGKDGTIIVVSHGVAIRQLLNELMLAGNDPMASAGSEGSAMGIFMLPSGFNTGITVLEYRCYIGESFLKLGLCMLNSAEHLGARLDLRSSFL